MQYDSISQERSQDFILGEGLKKNYYLVINNFEFKYLTRNLVKINGIFFIISNYLSVDINTVIDIYR